MPCGLRCDSRQTARVSSSTHATLAVVADHLARYVEQVADIAAAHDPERDADLVKAVYEAERAVRTAERAVRRAAKLAA